MIFRLKLLILILLMAATIGMAQPKAKPSFKVVPLGVKGGSDESNLSCYMIAPAGTSAYVCADAGTVRAGIDKAISNKVFRTTAANVLRNYIKGYLISHGHLDHVAGLILNSPDDTSKNIYAMPYVTDVLKDKYFTWQSWANFANEGDKPALNKYRYIWLEEEKEIPISNTGMMLTPFPLSHSKPYLSTAFLLNSNGSYLLYLGDTGSDTLERSDNLHKLWQYITPLIKARQLKAIFIEVSFPDEQPERQLFGHLTPQLLMREMNELAKLCGRESLKNVNIVITHRKPSGSNEMKIKTQLSRENMLGLKLVYPVQGRLMQF